jgi:hypothetical protein
MAQAATASSGPPPLSPPSSSGGKEEAPCGGSRIEVIRQLLPYIELPLAATTAPQCHVVDHVINDTSPLGPPPATTPASGRGGGKGDKGEMAHLDSLHQHSREHALLGKHPELPEDSGSGGGGCREAGSRSGSTAIENHSTSHTRAHTVLKLVGPATTTPSQKRAAMPKRSQSAATSREVPEILFHKSRKHRSKTEHKTLTRLASARRQ